MTDGLDNGEPTATRVVNGDKNYEKAPYAPPEEGTVYAVRDKAGNERVIRVTAVKQGGAVIEVETLESGQPPMPPVQVATDALARQASKGWCSLLVPLVENEIGQEDSCVAAEPDECNASVNVMMRLDIQNFGRCCGDIVRANLKFSPQLVKDIGDGPFRAGNYEKAFLSFEQLSTSFNSAVGNSRRAIADGRRKLVSEKGNLSGKEIQERTAAFIRGEQLINAAEREFSTILEGLRMYLRAQQTETQ